MNNKGTIFTPDQVRQISYGIQKGVMPIKFAYLTKIGSEGWGAIEKRRKESEEYNMDVNLMNKSLDAYLKELGNPEEIEVVDIGGGNGVTARSILTLLRGKSIGVHYHTIDISPILIKQCQERVSGLVQSSGGHLLDIDGGGIARKIREIKGKHPKSPILATLLGNTIGNFDSPSDIVRQISDGLSTSDKLIVGVPLSGTRYEDSTIEEYSTPTAFSMLSSTFSEFGVPVDSMDITVLLDKVRSTIEGSLSLKKEQSVRVGKEVIRLPKGYKAQVLKSQKFPLGGVWELSRGNRLAQFSTDKTGMYAQMMIAPNNAL